MKSFFEFSNQSDLTSLENKIVVLWSESENSLFRKNLELLVTSILTKLAKIQNKIRDKSQKLLDMEPMEYFLF